MTADSEPAPSGTEAGEPAGRPVQRPPSLLRQLGVFAFDIGAPIACYYLLRALGFTPLVALTVGAVPPAIAAGVQLARKRHVDPVALLVIATMAVSILVSAVSHSTWLLLAKDGMMTGLWGVVFVASVRARRPLAFSIARPLLEGRRAFAPVSWDDLWDDEPTFRRIWRVSSLVWGGALIVDAVIRVLMASWLPVDEVLGLGGLLWPVTFVVINVVTNVYYRRAGLYRILGRP